MPAAQKRKGQGSKVKVSQDRKNIWLLVVMTILIIGSIFMFMPPKEKINQGLDIQGGLSVVLTAKSIDGSEISDDAMEASRSVIESRVNALGASETVVQLQGTDQILVQIPGLSDTQEALNTIGKTGHLEFARLDSFTDETVREQIDSGNIHYQETYQDDFGYTFHSAQANGLKVEAGTYTSIVTGANINGVTIGKESDTSPYYAVNVELDAEGTAAFAEATADIAAEHGKIVIILDGEVQNAPAVQSVISTGEVSITGGYDDEGAKNLKTVLESGSLPVSFEYSQSQVVGPTLGQDALSSGILAAGIGLLIVILYLLVFYRGLGTIAAAAMMVFAVIYLGVLATLSHFGLFSLSLAGIAGIVLTIGMAADSSVLTLERFREEIRMGRSVRAASITGVRHAIETSIYADVVTLISAVVLFALAAASVKGFGLTLGLGILCDIFMMLVFKAPLIRLLAPRSISRHPGFWGIKDSLEASERYEGTRLAQGQAAPQGSKGARKKTVDEEKSETETSLSVSESKPKGRFIKRDINFIGHRNVFLIISAVLLVASVAVVGIKGVNLGIEFIGGTSVSFHGTGDIAIEDMRQAFTDAGEPDATIQTTNTDGENGYLIRTATVSAEEATVSANQVADRFGLSTDSFEVTTIGPDWGASVVKASLLAFLVSIVLIILVIAARFEYKMGVMAIASLFHDLILVVGIYALVGREVNPNTVAALLTILGYSLYDTVVVFHRINDNMKDESIKCSFMTMANHSVNQVIVRSINTSLTSLIPVLAMLFFGGETLKDFAFAMAIGIACGAYSSIFIATPLFAMWKTREPKYAKLEKKYGSEIGRYEFGNPRALEGGLIPKEAKVAKLADGSSKGASSSNGSNASAKEKAKNAQTSPTGASSSGKKGSGQKKKYKKKK